MEDVTYIIDKLHLADFMPIVITDEHFQILSCRERLLHIEQFFLDNSDLWTLLCEKAESQTWPVLYLEKGAFAYAVFSDFTCGRRYFLGPAVLGQISKEDMGRVEAAMVVSLGFGGAGHD